MAFANWYDGLGQVLVVVPEFVGDDATFPFTSINEVFSEIEVIFSGFHDFMIFESF